MEAWDDQYPRTIQHPPPGRKGLRLAWTPSGQGRSPPQFSQGEQHSGEEFDRGGLTSDRNQTFIVGYLTR